MKGHTIRVSFLLAAAALTVCLAGCEEADFSIKKTEEAPPAPPPPTPDELVAEAVGSLQVLNVIPPGIPLQYVLTKNGREEVVNYVREWKENAHQLDDGAAAVRKLWRELDDRLQPARHNQNAALVLLLCDLIEVLDPENPKVPRYREWARVYNNRPVVVIKGWFEKKDEEIEQTFVFCDVYLPEQREMHPVEVTEGEEFYGVKFEEIIGKNRGMRLRYLATGDVYEVYGPRPWDPEEAI